ncbi:pirin family protein [Paenibacillus hexagrammi]|uniref:Pirin family protein n=1 Tax=Paenibacillus hexagrammi TaxID=2908839 RepID=A0ABY3SJI3_9BACL|nr:pirin family protein [Paenibacillus sp. YPD9-1]UJF33540.1 pirin family protein [Paenibacillus sp. YPD9-1]
MHPHKAFEIMTYVIGGTVEHRDSLGTLQTVSAGGAQVMQAGSGIYHGEAFRGGSAEGLQIWFEPHLSEAVKHPATYNQYDHEQFPTKAQEGTSLKTVIGEGSPVHIQTEARMYDIQLDPGAKYSYPLSEGALVAFLAIRGSGEAVTGNDAAVPIAHKDFAVAKADASGESLSLTAGEEGLRVVAIELPEKPGYPLYRK